MILQKKVKTVGILLIMASTVCALSATHNAEAAQKPNPKQVVRRLYTKLQNTLAGAESRRDVLQNKTTDAIDRYNLGEITGTELHADLNKFKTKAAKARTKFDRKISRQTRVKLNKLKLLKADKSFLSQAIDKARVAHRSKHDLYDDLDKVLDTALASDWN